MKCFLNSNNTQKERCYSVKRTEKKIRHIPCITNLYSNNKTISILVLLLLSPMYSF